jgi:hypothetical protein
VDALVVEDLSKRYGRTAAVDGPGAGRRRVARSHAEASRWRCSAALTAGGRVRDRLAAQAIAGATLGVAGAATAAILTFGLLGTCGGPLSGAAALVTRGAGPIVCSALMACSARRSAWRSGPPPPRSSRRSSSCSRSTRCSPGSASRSPAGAWAAPRDRSPAASRTTFRPPGAGGLTLLTYAAALGAAATALTARRDVP